MAAGQLHCPYVTVVGRSLSHADRTLCLGVPGPWPLRLRTSGAAGRLVIAPGCSVCWRRRWLAVVRAGCCTSALYFGGSRPLLAKNVGRPG
jgi:hypothetical protein